MSTGRVTTGHPVDVASGEVYQELEDHRGMGLIDLVWSRRYSTAQRAQSGFWGPGWFSPFLAYVEEDLDGFTLRDPQGYLDSFDDPDGLAQQGQRIANPANGRLLAKNGSEIQVWLEVEGDWEVWTFQQQAGTTRYRLVARANWASHRLELRYAGERLVEVVQVRERRAYRLSYTASGERLERVTLVRDGQEQRVVAEYGYDAGGRLVSARVPGQAEGRYAYDERGRLRTEQTPMGCIFHFEYDGEDRCIHTYGPERFVQRHLAYSPFKTQVRDSQGHVTTYHWNESFQITETVSPKGNHYSNSYDDLGRLVQTVDPLGNTTQHLYNKEGDLVCFRDVNGGETRLERDGDKRLKVLVDPMGERWTFDYDGSGQLIQLNGPLGFEERFAYAIEGDLLEYREANGQVWSYRYDAYGNAVEEIDPAGDRTEYHHDALDRVVRIVQGVGRETQLVYGEVDQLIKVTWPDSSVSQYEYDAVGHVVQSDEDSDGRYRFEFGPCGRLRLQVDPVGGVTRYQWGSEPEQLLAVTNPLGESYQWEYDEEGQVIAETPFHGGTILYDLNARGEVVGWTDPAGQKHELVLDAHGQVLERRFAGQSLVSYAYDVLGRILSGTNAHGTVSVARDALGRIVQESFQGFWVHSEYDAMGYPTALDTSLDFHVRAHYNRPFQISHLEVGKGFQMGLAYDAYGVETMRRLPSGGTIRQQTNPVGKVMSQSLKGELGPGIERTWFYSARGTLTLEQDQRWGNRSFSLDPALRILISRKATGLSETFAYDAQNNLTQVGRGNLALRHEYQQGRLARRDGQTCVFDAAMVLRELYQKDEQGQPELVGLEWNPLGQLQSVRRGENTWTYAYDAFGRRFRKEGPEGVHLFHWCGQTLVHDKRGDELRSWFFEPGTFRPMVVVSGGQPLSCVLDPIGLVRELVDGHGRVVWSGDYLTWGQLDRQEGQLASAWPLRFQGQWYDPESGLHYNRFRYYDPETGHFVSPDPLDADGGLNLYAYPANPLVWTDPLGLLKTWQTARMGSSAHVNDGRDAHELLQSAWLRHNYGSRARNPYTGRGSGFGLNNPAIAIPPSIHRQVSRAQRAAGLHNASVLRGQTMRQNINANVRILRQVMIRNRVAPSKADAILKAMARQARAFAKANKCK